MQFIGYHTLQLTFFPFLNTRQRFIKRLFRTYSWLSVCTSAVCLVFFFSFFFIFACRAVCSAMRSSPFLNIWITSFKAKQNLHSKVLDVKLAHLNAVIYIFVHGRFRITNRFSRGYRDAILPLRSRRSINRIYRRKMIQRMNKKSM